LISEDLPTLLLPINANSGLSGLGHLSNEGLLIKYFASFMSISREPVPPLREGQRCAKSLNNKFCSAELLQLKSARPNISFGTGATQGQLLKGFNR